MHEVFSGTKGQGGYHHRGWAADKKSTLMPIVVKTKRIGGVKHYVTEGGRLFIAATYDKVFGKSKFGKE